ncbi:MAG: hypothetical protein QF574_06545 [Arenicellales bacterium]|nr:hypothetical protein [Arenicellales bacterium]
MARCGLPDIMQGLLGLRLAGFGQAVEHIHRLVHPAALCPGIGIDLLQSRPESHGTIADGQLRRSKSAVLQLQQYLTPALGGFSHAVLNRQKVLLAPFIDTNDHQDTESGVLGP